MNRCRMTVRLIANAVVLVQFAGASLQADETPTNQSTTAPLRVVTYNIKRGLGNDEVTDLTRTAGVLRKLKPDFVGLQEVDENTRRSGQVDQAVELGRQLKMHNAFASFMDYDGGRYGLAVLSRYPIEKTTELKLPQGNEPRVALVAEISLPDETRIVLVNVHFDWVNDDAFRYAQATAVKKFLDKLTVPYILLGDFNDQPGTRTLQLLKQGTVEAKKPADDRMTFSSIKPSLEIDFILAAPKSKWKVGQVDVIDEPVASDHRPVFAELSVVN